MKLIREPDVQELSTSTEIEGESKEERGIGKTLVKEMWTGKSQLAGFLTLCHLVMVVYP